MNPIPPAIHFGVAGILTGVSFSMGVSYLLLGFALPRLPASPLLLALFGLASGSVVVSIVQSIRTIGRGSWVGWGMLLANGFYALALAPVIAAHVGLALERR
jgi:hypothetical protein